MTDTRTAPPVITDADRRWAIEQCPTWADIGDTSDRAVIGTGRDARLSWSSFVAEQAEAFERHFSTQRKPSGEWSDLWRRSWWPSADPAKRHARLIPKLTYFRGTPEFARVLALAPPEHRASWERLPLLTLRVSDPIAAEVGAPAPLTPEAVRALMASSPAPAPRREKPIAADVRARVGAGFAALLADMRSNAA